MTEERKRSDYEDNQTRQTQRREYFIGRVDAEENKADETFTDLDEYLTVRFEELPEKGAGEGEQGCG